LTRPRFVPRDQIPLLSLTEAFSGSLALGEHEILCDCGFDSGYYRFPCIVS